MNIFKKIKNKYNKLSIPAKAAIWYTFCNFLNKGIALLTTPIFTRILTEEQYGTFAIYQSWFNILIIFTSLNIFLSGYTKGLLLYKNDEKKFTSSQLSLTSFITIFFFGIYIFNYHFWTKIFDLSPILMIGMFIELLLVPAMDFWIAKHRFDYKYKRVVIISIAMNLTNILVSVIAILNTHYKLEAKIFSEVIVKSMFAIPLFIYIIINGRKLYHNKYWKYALKFNIPLIPHYLSNYVLGQSDRIMIGKLIGKVQAAYYSVSYTISTVVNLFIVAINNSITPYIYKTIESGNIKNIKNKIRPITFFVAFLIIVIMLFAPEVIYVFAGKKYMDAIFVIPPVAASTYFYFAYLLYSNIEYYYQKTGLIAVATTISALLNIVLNYFGIKHFGYYAAGYTTLFCYILLAIFHYFFYKKIIKKELSIKNGLYDDKLIISTGIIIVIIMSLMLITYKSIYVRYGLLLVVCILIYIKRQFVKNVIKNIIRNKAGDNNENS